MMKSVRTAALGCCFSVLTAGLALADSNFDPIKTKQDFVGVVAGKSLNLMGIKLQVTPDGKIRGRAYGRDVTGQWRWDQHYFCRDLYWGKRDLGPNCQEVKVAGNTIRFTSDKGTGRYADLSLR